ncbi:MAG: hypothetical protein A2156_07700 [Deltaproteobacteria bacterium RBG_16_48_10]|nr:MAG: hypothetical protein A2156_07700 [Deltaproteobacteria bacterium RBG_16_48_10]
MLLKQVDTVGHFRRSVLVPGVGNQGKQPWGKTGQMGKIKYRISDGCPPTYLKLSGEIFIKKEVIRCGII